MDENEIINRIVKDGKVVLTRKDAEDLLYEICDRVHAGCDSECPIFNKFGHRDDCSCFKNGKKMFDELKKGETK